MKFGTNFQRKFKLGTMSVSLIAVVLVLIVLLNVGVGALCSSNRYYIDLTVSRYKALLTNRNKIVDTTMYRLTPEAEYLLLSTLESVNEKRPAGDPVRVDIIFCADPDLLCASERMRPIYYTALELQKLAPESIFVSTTDVWNNPSSVDAYRTTSYSSIYQTQVILASGSEFRIFSQRAFYTYSEATDTDPWAYNGEKSLIRGIMAVTRADAPVCALTVNHGEAVGDAERAKSYSELIKVIGNAGYDVVYLDLAKDPIPENCRLILTFDPQSDFSSDFLTPGTVSEIDKLDDFLGKSYSFLLFVNADTPKLTNLEEFMEEWGISLSRYSSAGTLSGCEVRDPSNALNASGSVFYGGYETEALGGSITEDLRKYGGSPKVVFGNAMPLNYSPTYSSIYVPADAEAGTAAYPFGAYFSNALSRDVYDLFRAGETAYTSAKGVSDESGNPAVADSAGLYKLMTLSIQSRTIGEGQGYTTVNDASYVGVVGSTDFASNECLSSNSYGNTDVLLSMLRFIGREVVPVGINFKSLKDAKMGSKAPEQAGVNAPVTTVIMTALPAVLFAVLGTVILIRRRHRFA